MADEYLQQLTEKATLTSSDYVPVSDAGASRLGKMLLNRLFVAEGLPGGQTVYGGTLDSNNLSISTTSASTQGYFNYNASWHLFKVNDATAMTLNPTGLGVGTTSAAGRLAIAGASSQSNLASIYMKPADGEPGSPVNGSIWNDSNKNFVFYTSGAKHRTGGALWTSSANKNVFSTAAETSLLTSTGIGSTTFPTDFWQAGKVVEIILIGIVTTGTSPPWVRIKGKVGGTTRLDSATMTFPSDLGQSANAYEGQYEIRMILTCHSTGSSGQFRISGIWKQDALSGLGMLALSLYANGSTVSPTFTMDTSLASALDVTVQFQTASILNNFECWSSSINVIG